MRKCQKGVFGFVVIFSINEKEKYNYYKSKYKGFYNEIFINNGYGLEITKRVIKI